MKAIAAIRIALKFSDMGMKHLGEMSDASLLRPGPWGGNHAMWIAGHLTVVEGRLQQMLHGTPNPVHHWKPLFDWGSARNARARVPAPGALHGLAAAAGAAAARASGARSH